MESWLTLPVIRLLAAVQSRGSLSAAARDIGMAQSNASRAIGMLERRLGFEVLHRSTRGSTLTEEGQLIAQWGTAVVEASDRMLAGMSALVREEAHRLRLGASMTIAEHLVTGWVSRFRVRSPEASVELQVHNSARIIDLVRSGRLDLGFVESPTIPDDVHSRTVHTDELVLVVSTGHPWASREAGNEPVSLEEIRSTGLVEREVGSGTRAYVDELVGADRAAPVMEMNSNTAILQAVRQGLGPSVMSTMSVRESLSSGELVQVPVEVGGFFRQLRAVWRSGPGQSGSASEQVKDFLAAL